MNKNAKPVRAGLGNPLLGQYDGNNNFEITCLYAETEYKQKMIGKEAQMIILDFGRQQVKIDRPIISFVSGNLIVEGDELIITKKN